MSPIFELFKGPPIRDSTIGNIYYHWYPLAGTLFVMSGIQHTPEAVPPLTFTIQTRFQTPHVKNGVTWRQAGGGETDVSSKLYMLEVHKTLAAVPPRGHYASTVISLGFPSSPSPTGASLKRLHLAHYVPAPHVQPYLVKSHPTLLP